MIDNGQGLITSTDSTCDEYCYSYNRAGSPGGSPNVRDFTFVGRGFCVNWAGDTYDYDAVGPKGSVQACAAACKRAFGYTGTFRGINYMPDGSSCNCMKDARMTNGQITGGNNVNDELCYAFNGASGVPAVE